eukprot:CAMPEP_0198452256 /NCGR_PEP_ID=MMETSP1453-20131121/6385_1 /TAXON_ID=1461543 ORGANISM="Unidentified sp., Strain RCC701" /NCGR_SAMPLE_ID=MMETSP1453 /ASSEMBLY_ACC=CAM_ASM_001118 /LENGTH=35 /DNA_ID= /DNA_START= /DNA_END= /DNA_ORIENTATION=
MSTSAPLNQPREMKRKAPKRRKKRVRISATATSVQ